jgi:hypothetical protein
MGWRSGGGSYDSMVAAVGDSSAAGPSNGHRCCAATRCAVLQQFVLCCNMSCCAATVRAGCGRVEQGSCAAHWLVGAVAWAHDVHDNICKPDQLPTSTPTGKSTPRPILLTPSRCQLHAPGPASQRSACDRGLGSQPWRAWALDGPCIIGAQRPFSTDGRLNPSAFTVVRALHTDSGGAGC